MGDGCQAQGADTVDKIRQLLPCGGIVRARGNVTFADKDGPLDEVEVLFLIGGRRLGAGNQVWPRDVGSNVGRSAYPEGLCADSPRDE